MKRVFVFLSLAVLFLGNSLTSNAETIEQIIARQIRTAIILVIQNMQSVKSQAHYILGDYDSQKATVNVKNFDLDLDKIDAENGSLTSSLAIPSEDNYSKTTLSDMIKRLENDMQSINDHREDYETAFKNFDQKVDQLLNMLSQTVKTQTDNLQHLTDI